MENFGRGGAGRWQKVEGGVGQLASGQQEAIQRHSGRGCGDGLPVGQRRALPAVCVGQPRGQTEPFCLGGGGLGQPQPRLLGMEPRRGQSGV